MLWSELTLDTAERFAIHIASTLAMSMLKMVNRFALYGRVPMRRAHGRRSDSGVGR